MVLAAVTATLGARLRRGRRPPRPGHGSSSSSSHASSSASTAATTESTTAAARSPAVAALLRPRAPPPAAAALCDVLAELAAPLPQQLQTALAERVSGAPALLEGLVALAIEHDGGAGSCESGGVSHSGSATATGIAGAAAAAPRLAARACRTRAASSAGDDDAVRSVVAFLLLADGPRELRAALAARIDLLRALIAALHVSNPASTRDRAAEMLRACLVDQPSRVGEALTDTPGALGSIVAAIPVTPVAGQLLARLVGAKTVGAPDRTFIVPCHRKAICFLTSAQGELRDRCLASDTPHDHRPALVHVMAELSARAIMLERKKEDPDERIDGHFVSYMKFATPAAYNDARVALNLLEIPAPIIDVLDEALACHFNQPHETAFLSAVLSAIATIFDAVRYAKRSLIPSVRNHASTIGTAPLSQAVLDRLPALISRLDLDDDSRPLVDGAICYATSSRPLGSLRLAIADAMVSLLYIADAQTRDAALSPPLSIHVGLLRLANMSSPASRQILLARFAELVRVAMEESDGHLSSVAHVSASSGAWTSRAATMTDENDPAAMWLADGLFLRRLVDTATDESMPAMNIITHAVLNALSRPSIRAATPTHDVHAFCARFPSSTSESSPASKAGLLSADLPAVLQVSSDLGWDLFDEDVMSVVSEDDVHRVCLEQQLQEAANRSHGGADEAPLDELPGRRGRRISRFSRRRLATD
jgi:hypothetical protein